MKVAGVRDVALICQFWLWGLLPCSRPGCQSPVWDSQNQWVSLLLTGMFPSNSLGSRKEMASSFGAQVQEHVWYTSRCCSFSVSWLLPKSDSGFERVKELCCGLDCLATQWECVSQRHSLSLSRTGLSHNFPLDLFMWATAHLLLPEYKVFFHFYIELPCSSLYKHSQCEFSLYTLFCCFQVAEVCWQSLYSAIIFRLPGCPGILHTNLIPSGHRSQMLHKSHLGSPVSQEKRQ